MQCADPRMIQRGDRPRLALEALLQIGIGGKVLRQDLDGNRAIEASIASPVHFPHSAGTERHLNLIGAESCARRKRHSRQPLYWPASRQQLNLSIPSVWWAIRT